MTEEYKLLLDQYKKEGLETTYKDLYEILYSLDSIYKAFDMLALQPDKITKEIM